ncbi:PKD domain-containing protein [Microbulbifer salipaludis]|uniref:PKD domain-containing protein n=1 Tax=Microbulbifer salipaludis TaxID=187980 RepID=A0ABS3E7M0_9GAMM|nr:PKD domain-containing protein [Microbulbifer salipaludis]MBN8431280.1 PKD domain-containing protein [Microbulbifer salipaludis]
MNRIITFLCLSFISVTVSAYEGLPPGIDPPPPVSPYDRCGITSLTSGFPTTAYAQRVSYCRNDLLFPCNNKIQSDFYEWENNNVAKDKQRRTIIATYNEPPRSNVDTLMYFSMGQYFSSNDIQASNIGMCDDWNWWFDHNDTTLANGHMPIMPGSVPKLVATNGDFDMESTFIAIAVDARFNYDFTLPNQREIIQAHYQWLKKKFYTENLKFIYLAGHSRGGALVTHLAAKFKEESPEIPVMVHLYDPVANPDNQHNELGTQLNTYPSKVYNPRFTDVSYWAWLSDLENTSFETPEKRELLYIHNLLSGDPFIGSFFEFLSHKVRAFAEVNSQNLSDTKGSWYKQSWLTYSHNGMANTNDVQRYNELVNKHEEFTPLRERTMEPIAECKVTPSTAEGQYASVTFSDDGSASRNGTNLTYSWYLSNGTTRTGKGPFTTTVFTPDNTSMNHTFRLTVTDAYGNNDSMTCSVFVSNYDSDGTCLEGSRNCLEPAL